MFNTLLKFIITFCLHWNISSLCKCFDVSNDNQTKHMHEKHWIAKWFKVAMKHGKHEKTKKTILSIKTKMRP